MRGRSLHVHGRTFSEPRSTLAQSQGRMPGDRAAGGVFLWLPFFAQAKKVTRSPAGRVETLRIENSKEPDSGFHWNDEQEKTKSDTPEQTHPHPTLPLKGRARACQRQTIEQPRGAQCAG
jgi:hypothetical protein